MPPDERHIGHSGPSLCIYRRCFLRWGLAAVAAFFTPHSLKAATSGRTPASDRRLAFFNTHTGECLEACYSRDGRYDTGALREINHILRDHRTGEVGVIATGLLDLLHHLSRRFEIPRPFHVISGYRSAETNAALRQKGRGVASQSLHMCGQAIDIRVPGIRTSELKSLGLSLAAGGVGYYPRPDFVHLDIGQVRSW